MIYLLGGLGFFFSALVIFYNNGYRSANIYLGLFLFFFNFIILSHYIYIFIESAEVISFVLLVPINSTAYAVGPLSFIFTKINGLIVDSYDIIVRRFWCFFFGFNNIL